MGEGESPVFSPQAPETARLEIAQRLSHPPSEGQVARSRWRLIDLKQAVSWLRPLSVSGIWQVLDRLHFHLKKGALFIHSPDPEYAQKWAAIQQARQESQAHPEEVVLLYLDELTYYRRPSLAYAYWPAGKSQPRALDAPRSNTQTRLLAVLNAHTGRVIYLQLSKIGKKALQTLYAEIAKAYSQAKKIYIVQDNWPVHKLPEVMQAMTDHHLSPLFLPTYASWLNPIEKLWKWLKQTLIHMHALADQIEILREKVKAFLDQFNTGSILLLHYVGLLSD